MRLTPDRHLHSREHLLADDLSRAMLEPKRFAAYLGIAKMYDQADLRALAKRIIAMPNLDPGSRGKYFFGSVRGLAKRADWLGELGRRRRRRRVAAKRKRRLRRRVRPPVTAIS